MALQKQNCYIFSLGPCSFSKRKQTKMLTNADWWTIFHTASHIRFPMIDHSKGFTKSTFSLFKNKYRKKNLSNTKSNPSYILQGLLKLNKETKTKNQKPSTVANYCCLPMSTKILDNKKRDSHDGFIVTLTHSKNAIKNSLLFSNQAES